MHRRKREHFSISQQAISLTLDGLHCHCSKKKKKKRKLRGEKRNTSAYYSLQLRRERILKERFGLVATNSSLAVNEEKEKNLGTHFEGNLRRHIMNERGSLDNLKRLPAK